MYNYKLDKDDFVTSLLYAASQSKKVFRARVRSWFLWTAGFLGLGFVLLGSDTFLAQYFIVVGIIYMVFFPFYSRWRYKRIYSKRVSRNFKNRLNANIQLTLNKEFISTLDSSGETKIKCGEIAKIDEIQKILMIRVNTGATLIIPTSLQDYPTIRNQMQEITHAYKIPWLHKPYWKWR